MKYRNVQMLGISHVDAPETVSSEEIESRLAPALSRLGIPKGILKKLFHHGLELGLKTWEVAREALNWRIDDIDQFVIHQVGKAHTEKFARTLGVPLSKIFRLYPKHGNIGPAGVPIALSKLVASGTLKDGDRIALMGIGSGINCSMAELVW